MVRGLQIFRESFQPFLEHYILIGGTACDIIMVEAGLEFRATKDLDIVLCAESLDSGFVAAFWEFVRMGGYRTGEQGNGEKKYYRFSNPADIGYPALIELFARKPDVIRLKDGVHLTPIPMENEVSSLSAILLDDEYYGFIRDGRSVIEDVSVCSAAQLIGLKAKAWLDLSARREAGERIDSRNIAKHKNDVFRLYRVLDPELRLAVPGRIRADMDTFLRGLSAEGFDTRSLGMRVGLDDVAAQIRRTYGIAS